MKIERKPDMEVYIYIFVCLCKIKKRGILMGLHSNWV